MSQKFGEIGSDGEMTSCIDTNAITRITTKIHRVRWTIENVSEIVLDAPITGPEFHLTLTLSANLAFKMDQNNLFVYVRNKSDARMEFLRTIFLLDCNDKKLHEDTDANIFRLKKDCTMDILSSVQDRCKFNALPKNTLIIDLTISLRGDVVTEVCDFQNTKDPKKKLIDDFKTMQKNSISTDIFLQVGNVQIPAHWSILCARSTYFKNMFDSKMLERVQNEITITDVSLSSLQKLVKFLYTAEFDEDLNENLEELSDMYYAADKYEVMDLRALIGCKIMSKSTTDNICEIFQLAYRHNDEDLKLQAMEYIHFHSDAVFQTDGWKKFQASEPLAAELFIFCLKKK